MGKNPPQDTATFYMFTKLFRQLPNTLPPRITDRDFRQSCNTGRIEPGGHGIISYVPNMDYHQSVFALLNLLRCFGEYDRQMNIVPVNPSFSPLCQTI